MLQARQGLGSDNPQARPATLPKLHRSIVKATILMAHELGLSCLAEGVESESQHQHLLELGCDSFQGFLLGQPMPAEQVKELIRASVATSSNGD